MAASFKVGLVQMAMSRRPGRQRRAGRRGRARGGAGRRRRSSACRSCSARRTSARARTRRSSTWPSRSRAHDRGARRAAAKDAGVAVVVPDLRAARGRPLPQHRGRPRRRRRAAGPLPQDAHPRRPALLREVLLHAGRPRLPRVRHAGRPHRHARLLGPVVPGGRAAHGARRAPAVLFYPTAIGWHPHEKAEYGAAPARRLADDPARRTRSPTASTSRP